MLLPIVIKLQSKVNVTLPYAVQPDDASPTSSYVEFSKVWRALFAHIASYGLVSAGLFVIFELLGWTIPAAVRPFVHVGIVFLPVLLWAWLIWRALRLPAMLLVCIVAMLAANGVSMPIFNAVFSSDSWLATQTTTNRIIGYTLTFGALHVFVQYAVLRYLAWHYVETDDHAVSYAATVAVGYAAIISLNLLQTPITTGALSARAFAHFSVFMSTNLFLAYALARVQFDNAFLLFMPMMLVFSAAFAGLVTTIRAGIQNAAFSVAVTASRPLFGFVFSVIIIVVSSVVVYFFFNRIALQRMLANNDV